MIVDCHTRIWSCPDQLGQAAPAAAPGLRADEGRHLRAAEPVDKSIVLAFKSRYLGAEVPNRLVADYVRRNPDKLVGFAGIDPLDDGWPEELRIAQEELHLKGVVVSPAMQNFHPADTRAMRLYEECARRGMPVLFEPDLRYGWAKLAYAQPTLLDEVALELPQLKMVIARMGYPWVEQTVVLLAKHRNLYADLAGLLPRRWLSYTALLTAHEYGVMDKLLLGSDFPHHWPAACIEALYSLNQFAQGGSLPAIPREQLRGIVERDTLGLLGIGSAEPLESKTRSPVFVDEE